MSSMLIVDTQCKYLSLLSGCPGVWAGVDARSTLDLGCGGSVYRGIEKMIEAPPAG